MSWHRLGRFKEGPQNLHELHVSNVYQDNEFIEDVESIFPDRGRLLELRRQNPYDTQIEKQLIDRLKAIMPHQHEVLAKKYSISTNDVVWFLRGNNMRDGEFYRLRRKPFKGVERDDETVTIKFNRDITKEDYLEAWNQWIVPLKEKVSQPKLPLHDKLLYAIFKAREQRGETFRQIFEQYESGRLPYYTGSSTMFADNQKKFEEYYRKYKV